MTRSNARELALHLILDVDYTRDPSETVVDTRMDADYYATLQDENEVYADRPNKKQLSYIRNVTSGVQEKEAELRDYARLKEVGIPMPLLLEADIPNERILKEYIEGETIAALVPAGGVKQEYLEQVRAMCRLLYPPGLHIDYYPTNFVVREDTLYYIDYECNAFMDEWSFERWGIQYWLPGEQTDKAE